MTLPSLLWFFAFPFALVAAATEVRFDLPGTPLEVVTDESKFAPFAKAVSVEVERLFGIPEAVDDPATLRLLLSTRVHLAHHYSDNDAAITTAAWIRSLQIDPASRAFAGLTTLAAVEARRRHVGVAASDDAFRRTFLEALSRWLEGLPRSQEMLNFLQGQRQKIAEISEPTLLKEVSDVIEPSLARRGYCGLIEADQLVRVRHRLLSILPVRAETLQAIDGAIAARKSR